MGKTKDSVASLGKQLIKDKQKGFSKHLNTSQRHVLDFDDSKNSKIETTTLEEFMTNAHMANIEFTAERQGIKIIDPNQRQIANKMVEIDNEEKSEAILIPRRPKWDETTTAEDLNQLEYDKYLEWRRHLAVIQESEDIVMTPFEKNIEFWRQLWRVVERSDVCVQILDARNPLLFVSEDLQKYVKEVDERKENVILLNKSDFLSETQRQIWAKHFDLKNMKALFFSAKEQLECDEDIACDEDIDDIINSRHNSSKLLNREQLIDFFKSFRLKNSSEPITIGLVGYPNVGKSSTINAILQSKRVSVSATPGKTKHFQTLILDNELTLCDCPGLVFPNIVSSKAEMIVNGILPIDQLKDPIPPTSILTNLIPRYVFESHYTICLPKPTEYEDENRFVTPEELLTTYGFSRGFMTQRGIPDNCRSARYILKDFVSGKLNYCFAPPDYNQKVFHVFPENQNKSNLQMPSALKRILESSQITKKSPQDFNDLYFGAKNAGIHTKGVVPGIRTQQQNGSVTEVTSKPWKKHNNRNKKEKLRRVYAHLDQ
ncbi:large subunit GTPase 1 homolog [Oppia nitens]|uniref:large subunit GTPase 1 homolog n=1 Tax=Oppia nitens TaxID=1686743 RepID=UPI0023DB2CF9|nr:large subunit GTPase 1 homolog [Oppia nitens]